MSCSVVSSTDTNFDAGGKPAAAIDVGVLPPHGHKALKQFIEPRPDETGEDAYVIYISAQNGVVSEVLKFRKGKKNVRWAYIFTASKQSPRGPQTPSRNTSSNVQTISTDVWSDDPEFGKGAQR
jgi:hypothetical protein